MRLKSTNSTKSLNKVQNNASFADTPFLSFVRWVFPLISQLMPELTSRISLFLFLTPKRHRIPKWEEKHVASARKQNLWLSSKKIALYTWGNENSQRKVLLCHAWGGRGTQLGDFIEPLIKEGFFVIAFDALAHGASDGRRTDMMEYSMAIHRIIEHYNGIDAIVGHSFGAGNVMFSKKMYAFDAKHIVLIGCFAHGKWVAVRFGEILNIPHTIIEKMCALLEKKYKNRLNWNQLDIVNMVSKDKSSILVIHDKHDKEIPYSNAEKFQDICCTNISTYITEGLGHRRIIRDTNVIFETCKFITSN